METESKVAERFMEARGINADYGDVSTYHNVFDYFEAEGRRLDHDETLMLMDMIEEAIYTTKKKSSSLIRRALKSNSADRKVLLAHGIQIK